MTGFPNFVLGAGAGFCGALYYYDNTGSAYNAVGGHSSYTMSNGKTVIVWDMHSASIDGTGSGALWKNMTPANAPVKFEPYWAENLLNNNDYMVWCGMVLSDRILTDIPTPIRTHMG